MENSCVAILKAFFSAMHQWEINCHLRAEQVAQGGMAVEERRELDLAELKLIFDKYCICTKAFPKGVTYATPPSNDVNAKIVNIEMKGNKTFITIERGLLPLLLQYTIIDTEAGPRVSDNVKIYNAEKQKFVSYNILL